MTREKKIAVSVVALVSLLLQLANFPARHDLRHGDEHAYLAGSLQLLEGMVPEYKYSPAGPQTWIGWAYAGLQSARYVVLPTAEERAVPIQVRPFVAVNHAIWDNYHDMSALRWVWVLFAMPFIVWSAVSGFNLGFDRAGMAGGVLGGGIVAFLPILVKLSGEGRPYALGWALAIIALDLMLVRREKSYLVFGAIMFGLAVGSRIDMLMIAPLIWSELWSRRKEGGFIRSMVRFHGIALMTALLVAPWLLTNLIGNLRIIATVRLADPTRGRIPLSETLRDLALNEGMLLLVPLVWIGLFVRHPGERWPRIFLAAYVIVVTLSLFKATGFGLQHQGGPLVVIVALCAGILPVIANRSNRAAWVVVIVLLAMPFALTIRDTWHRRRDYVSDGSVQWINQHIPAGTRVYYHNSLKNPLPTVESSDFLWSQVNGDFVWEKKFESGLARFHLTAGELPRALSDENMLVERDNRRDLFILGSRPSAGPRFDLRIVVFSPVFPAIDPSVELPKTGGVVLWRSDETSNDPDVRRQWDDLRKFAGDPVASWAGAYGHGAYIFVSPDIRAKLNQPTTRPTSNVSSMGVTG